jgi:hypothetical protein
MMQTQQQQWGYEVHKPYFDFQGREPTTLPVTCKLHLTSQSLACPKDSRSMSNWLMKELQKNRHFFQTENEAH